MRAKTNNRCRSRVKRRAKWRSPEPIFIPKPPSEIMVSEKLPDSGPSEKPRAPQKSRMAGVEKKYL